MKKFKGKALYNPDGKAGEYAHWACNLYVGCSNSCEYCYCKKGILAKAMGADEVSLKKCFSDPVNAREIYVKEMLNNKKQIIKDGGVFFTFTTDPCLKDTRFGYFMCANESLNESVPVTMLTKRADWLNYVGAKALFNHVNKNLLCIGFTLTGCDEQEKFASTNNERIQAMKAIHNMGIKTFASIEPVIDIDKSIRMIEQTLGFCDIYKIGLMSGKHDYDSNKLDFFVGRVSYLVSRTENARIYWKDSIKKELGHDIICSRSINSDYNIFKEL